jgi:hypothetical protein
MNRAIHRGLFGFLRTDLGRAAMQSLDIGQDRPRLFAEVVNLSSVECYEKRLYLVYNIGRRGDSLISACKESGYV